jgi:hypothetical protein
MSLTKGLKPLAYSLQGLTKTVTPVLLSDMNPSVHINKAASEFSFQACLNILAVLYTFKCYLYIYIYIYVFLQFFVTVLQYPHACYVCDFFCVSCKKKMQYICLHSSDLFYN